MDKIIICKQCGAEIVLNAEFVDDSEIVICQHCGAEIVVNFDNAYDSFIKTVICNNPKCDNENYGEKYTKTHSVTSLKQDNPLSQKWTNEMIEQLKDLWDQGCSAGEISKKLNISKNAIIGKAHRLKLPSRPSPIKMDGFAVMTTKNKEVVASTEPQINNTNDNYLENTTNSLVNTIQSNSRDIRKLPKTIALEQKILKMNKEGKTQREISEELGFNKAYISKILTSNGIYAKGKAKRVITAYKESEGPISEVHFEIGKFFHIYRMYSLRISIPEMAKRLKLSDRKVRCLEEGKLNFTLEWLQKTLGSNFKEVMIKAITGKD